MLGFMCFCLNSESWWPPFVGGPRPRPTQPRPIEGPEKAYFYCKHNKCFSWHPIPDTGFTSWDTLCSWHKKLDLHNPIQLRRMYHGEHMRCQVSVPWRLPPGLGPVGFTVPPASTDAVSPSNIFHSIPFQKHQKPREHIYSDVYA